MTVQRKYLFTAFLLIVALILSACGAASNDSRIATSVAMTVQAEHTQEPQSPATPTRLPGSSPTSSVLTLPSITPVTTNLPPTAPTGGVQLCTASASFISETIPDGTITSPGSVFTKIWRIKNTGTCSWNSSWKFVYVSGDLLGGSAVYNFPEPAAPGDTVNVPIVLTAPQEGGSYKGYWKIQSPWGLVFGDTDSGNPFWVDIVVGSGTPGNSKTETAYGITDVTVQIARACTPANTFYTITANLTSNGPVSAIFTWVQSDGNNKGNNKLTFAAAETKSASRDWSQHIGSSENPRWVQVIVTDPVYQEFPQVELPPLCW